MRCAGRAILQSEVSVFWIAEERIFRDVSIDAVLVGNVTFPISTLVTKDVAANQDGSRAGFAVDSLGTRPKGHNSVLHEGGRPIPAIDPASILRGRIVRDGAVHERGFGGAIAVQGSAVSGVSIEGAPVEHRRGQLAVDPASMF
jgi:hypothetical protein